MTTSPKPTIDNLKRFLESEVVRRQPSATLFGWTTGPTLFDLVWVVGGEAWACPVDRDTMYRAADLASVLPQLVKSKRTR